MPGMYVVHVPETESTDCKNCYEIQGGKKADDAVGILRYIVMLSEHKSKRKVQRPESKPYQEV
ncbi:hypothetical protein GCM10028895_32760 [Pontibacter rugosus]